MIIYIGFLFFTVLVLAFVFYQWQYFMLFTPTYFRDGELDENFEILSITTDDKVELEGVIFTPQNPRNTLLFFAGRLHDSVGLIKKLSTLYPETRIITFNYRSYGRSEGIVSEKKILSDGIKIAGIVKKNYGDFYLLGFSIGSSVASFVATKIDTKALFLVGTFDSIASLVKVKYRFIPSWFLRYKFDNTKLVKDIDTKTYLFVGVDDEITYIQNSRNLKSYVKNLVLYKELDNLTHKDLLWDSKVTNEIRKVLQ
ncbi:MAG: alpha/beta hydrolase [Campylobacterota bacterium]|nr:alpha/beta hydrolase [Campylobacterota bacterium]